MPYSNISNLPELVKSLPIKAKKIFLKAFNSAISQNNSEEVAFKIAWSAVKKVFKKKGDSWVLKTDVNVKTAIAKSGFFKPQFYFDAVLSSDKKDSTGQKVSRTLLEHMSKNNKIDEIGDLEHLGFYGVTEDYKGLFKKIKHVYDDGKLYVRFHLNRDHIKFKSFIESNKNKELALSAEFIDPRIINDTIIYASNIGWSLTENPANEDANIIGIGKLE